MNNNVMEILELRQKVEEAKLERQHRYDRDIWAFEEEIKQNADAIIECLEYYEIGVHFRNYYIHYSSDENALVCCVPFGINGGYNYLKINKNMEFEYEINSHEVRERKWDVLDKFIDNFQDFYDGMLHEIDNYKIELNKSIKELKGDQ